MSLANVPVSYVDCLHLSFISLYVSYLGTAVLCTLTPKFRTRCANAVLCRYVYLLMGVLIGSAVVPIACCLSWSKCTATAAISGAWGGLAASVTCWLVYTKCVYGEITLDTTGKVRLTIAASIASGKSLHTINSRLLRARRACDEVVCYAGKTNSSAMSFVHLGPASVNTLQASQCYNAMSVIAALTDCMISMAGMLMLRARIAEGRSVMKGHNVTTASSCFWALEGLLE